MGNQDESWNLRIIVAALSLVAFPLLIMIAFYASRTLVPSLAKIQFAEPTQNVSAVPTSERTIQRPVFNGSEVPGFLNFSFPGIPSITYSDILFAIAVIVVAFACLQAFRVISNRRSIKSVSDIEVLIEERNRVANIIDETVRKLSLGSNYRDTVLKCYKLIAESLEAKSSVDGRALTASEFMKIVSERLKLNSPNLSKVTSLFEVARYSENEVTRENANEAIECLSSLSSELKTMDIPVRESIV
jgi:hypothetical protein